MPDKNHSIGSKQTDNQTPLTQYSRFCPCDFFFRALRCLQFTEHWSFSIKNQKQNYYLSTSDKRKKTEHLNNLACVQRMVNCTCGWPNDQEYAF